MINALKALFEAPPRESEEQLQARLHLAAAALLIETSRADFKQDMAEQQAVEKLLSEALGLPPGQVHDLMVNATSQVDEATSLYEFTRVINDHYSPEQKLKLVRAMWIVAYADGNLDKYEEALIRQVAELTYVPHQDYIRCKLQASGSA